MPDHFTFSKSRYGIIRDSDQLRELLEMTVSQCMAEELAARVS